MTIKLKKSIRKQLTDLRNKLTPRQKISLSHSICNQILSHTVFQQSHSIVIYSALGNEVNLSELCDNPHDKLFFLPVIGKNNSMVFKHCKSNSRLIENKFGIPEPTSGQIIEENDIDLCLVPLVGFNRKGDRLGMGGGYYDRYFENNKSQKKPTILAGIAYDFQEDDTIQAESWDIPLDIIFTNKEVIIP